VSTNRWRRALKDGEVLLDGCRVAKGVSLRVGQELSFADDLLICLESAVLLPEAEPILEILFEDENLLALNKPANCHTHPLSSSETGTLTNHLIAVFPELAGVGEFGPLQPGLLNRLDYATSGVVLVARNNATWLDLRGQFERHLMRKEYLAEVAGELLHETVIEKDLTHDRGDRRRMLVSPPAAPCRGLYSARTEVFPLQFSQSQNLTQVRLVMYSGVMHQLRVHLADIGHPIFADPLYGYSLNPTYKEKDKEKELGVVTPGAGFHLHCLQMTLADGLVIGAPPPGWYKIKTV
ncbi:MAG: RluA family pseudouridine synthase, partial [Deltaproteobacteria bacterium]|nr:RluA family pseudouridine synthase [Candidatus Tharpella sp.]